MADDDRNAMYRPSPPGQWGPTPHIYPHTSHGTPHGTPSHEFSGFSFASPQIPMEPGGFGASIHPRPNYPPLQPLMTTMPQWPSMLGQSQPSYQPVYPPPMPPIQAIQPAQPAQPMSADSSHAPAFSKSTSTPRKTLTDLDRKRMCQYAEEHPSSKQTEIGAIFGVERSTVSKVLRQKEKYLLHDDGSRSPVKRAKGRSPDIERALANWARNQEKKGVPLTDESIREKARYFATTTTTPDNHVTLSSSWIEKFKLKNNLMGARRKVSLVPDDGDSISASQTPNDHSPSSQQGIGSPSPTELHSQQSHESLKTESPDVLYDFGRRHNSFQANTTASLNGAYTDTAHPSFSPGPFSPNTSPFFTPDSGTSSSPFVPPLTARPILHADTSADSHRQRSQTFPMMDHTMSSSAETITAGYGNSALLDSPMEGQHDSLTSIGQVMSACKTDERPSTVSPAEMMRPPPLPAHVLQNDVRRDSAPSTSPEEARRALQSVINFITQQPDGFLDLQETLTIGKLMEKLRFRGNS